METEITMLSLHGWKENDTRLLDAGSERLCADVRQRHAGAALHFSLADERHIALFCPSASQTDAHLSMKRTSSFVEAMSGCPGRSLKPERPTLPEFVALLFAIKLGAKMLQQRTNHF
jgi:hypothetical protein